MVDSVHVDEHGREEIIELLILLNRLEAITVLANDIVVKLGLWVRVECVNIEWQFGLGKNLIDFDLPCLSVVDVPDQVLLGSLVEDVLNGMLLRDGSDLFVVLLVGLIDLLRTMLVHLGDILDDQLSVRVDRLVDDALGLLIGLVNDLVDLLLLLELSLSDLQILFNRVLSLKLLEALLDLLND